MRQVDLKRILSGGEVSLNNGKRHREIALYRHLFIKQTSDAGASSTSGKSLKMDNVVYK